LKCLRNTSSTHIFSLNHPKIAFRKGKNPRGATVRKVSRMRSNLVKGFSKKITSSISAIVNEAISRQETIDFCGKDASCFTRDKRSSWMAATTFPSTIKHADESWK